MAQTTSGFTVANAKIEVSTDGSSWTNISGSASKLEISGGEQMTGEKQTADGSAPIVVPSNKVSATTVKASIVYTETSGEAFPTVWARYSGSTKTIYFRYSPRGGSSGQKRYFSADDAGSAFACPIIACLPPNTDADSGDVSVTEFPLMMPKLAQEAVA